MMLPKSKAGNFRYAIIETGRLSFNLHATPQPLDTPVLAMAVLAFAVLTNSYAVSLIVRKLVGEHGSLRNAFRTVDEPLVKSALLRDVIGTFTSVVGLVALILYQDFGYIFFDAPGVECPIWRSA